MSLFEAIIRPLTPLSCLSCGTEGQLLCFSCQNSACPPMLPRCYRCRQRVSTDENIENVNNIQPLCAVCRPLSPLQNIWAGTHYSGIAKQLVHQLKFERLSAASGTMSQVINRQLPNLQIDLIIVPVPTATKRVRQRGYDQACLLAKQIAKSQHRNFQKLLGRFGQTRQVGAQRHQRLEQLQNMFYVKNVRRLPHRVLLVDDILTTGATLESAARVLQQAGVQHVEAAVFAQKV